MERTGQLVNSPEPAPASRRPRFEEILEHEAEREYREILRENPENVDAVRLLGRVALSAGRLACVRRSAGRRTGNLRERHPEHGLAINQGNFADRFGVRPSPTTTIEIRK